MRQPTMHKKSLGVLFLTVALDLLGFGIVVPLLPLYARQFDVSPSAIGWLLASYSLMQFVFAPLWGALSDRVGRRPVLLCSIGGNAVALAVFASATTFFGLFLSRALAGFCAANIAVAGAYIADVSAPEDRPRRMGLIGAAFGLGFVLGPVLAGELSGLSPSAPALFASSLAVINLFSALWFLPESLPVLATPEDQVPCRRPQQPITPWAERLLALKSMPQLWPYLALTFVQIFGFAMMELTLTLFVTQHFGFSVQSSGRMLAFVGLNLVLVQGGAIGPLSRRLTTSTLVMWGFLAMALGLLGLAQSARYTTPFLFFSLALLAMGQGLLSPSLSSLVTQKSGAHRFGMGLGLSQSASALARVTGPICAGYLIHFFSLSAPLYAGAVSLALGFVGIVMQRRQERVPGSWAQAT